MASPEDAFALDLNLFDTSTPYLVSSPDSDWSDSELNNNITRWTYRKMYQRDNSISITTSGNTAAVTATLGAGTGESETDFEGSANANLNAKDANGSSASKSTTWNLPYVTNGTLKLHPAVFHYLDLSKITGTLNFDAFTASSTYSYSKRNIAIPKQTHSLESTGTLGTNFELEFDRTILANGKTQFSYNSGGTESYVGFKFVLPIVKGQKFQAMGETQTLFLGNWSLSATQRGKTYMCDNAALFLIANGTATRIEPGADQLYTAPFDADAVVLTYRCPVPTSDYDSYGAPLCYIKCPVLYKIDMLPAAIAQDQTDQLKDTTGSDSILNGVVNENQSVINQKLGFISQTGEIVGGTYDAFMNSDPSGSITFPGVTWDGKTIIAVQQVPIIPSGFEDIAELIRTFNTGVLALLWVRGIRHLYGRIFLNETDVIVDDE